MKRDMDVVRQILFAIEADNTRLGTTSAAIAEKIARSPSEVGYHVKLLVEAGLLTADEDTSMDSEGTVGF
jgi:DNA-binding Lrp family transcriptional regulator